MTYEDAVRRWAATKLDCTPDEIKAVEFSIESNNGCPTCGPTTDIIGYIVRSDGSHATLERGSYEFGELLREIVAAADDAAERSEAAAVGPFDNLTAEQAEAAGFTVDRHCYPWVAYKGSRFDPDEWRWIMTPGVAR